MHIKKVITNIAIGLCISVGYSGAASANQSTPISLQDVVIYDGLNDGYGYTWATGLGGYFPFLSIGTAIGPLINAGDGSINSSLDVGLNTFYVFGDWDPIAPPDTLTINLFFHPAIGGFWSTDQDISASTENNTNAPFTSNLIVQPYPNAFHFLSGNYEVSLVDFNLSIVDGTGIDRVSSFNGLPNGRRDAVGLFTLNVVDISAVPEPLTWMYMLVGMAGIGVTARARRLGSTRAAI